MLEFRGSREAVEFINKKIEEEGKKKGKKLKELVMKAMKRVRKKLNNYFYIYPLIILLTGMVLATCSLDCAVLLIKK
jgi:hypothetical protein